jgi:hypothetical protein
MMAVSHQSAFWGSSIPYTLHFEKFVAPALKRPAADVDWLRLTRISVVWRTIVRLWLLLRKCNKFLKVEAVERVGDTRYSLMATQVMSSISTASSFHVLHCCSVFQELPGLQ